MVSGQMNMERVCKRPISDAEWSVRRDLAACYRLVALFGWDDLIATHLSARIPGEEAFLINPFGMLFEEITDANLVRVNANGEKLDESPYPVNRAGFVIHGAIHEARPDVGCVMHLHTKDGVAVSTVAEGLLPLNQAAIAVSGSLAYHDYEGIAVDIAERERLLEDLGNKNLMILRNHGTLATGRSVGDCFLNMYDLENSCSTQVRTLGMGLPLSPVPAGVIEKVRVFRKDYFSDMAEELYWPALLRRAERECPGFQTRRVQL